MEDAVAGQIGAIGDQEDGGDEEHGRTGNGKDDGRPVRQPVAHESGNEKHAVDEEVAGVRRVHDPNVVQVTLPEPRHLRRLVREADARDRKQDFRNLECDLPVLA